MARGDTRVFFGHPGRKRRSSGRHKWRPYVFSVGGCGLRRRCGRMRRAASGVARRGAIYDARCRGGTRCRPHFARRHPHFLQHSGWFRRSSGRHKWRPYVLRFLYGRLWVAASLRAFSVAVVDCRIVGAPFMTPGARGGTRCRSHGARRYPHFLWHSEQKRQSSGRHKWRPYVCCAGGCGVRRRVIWPTCGGCSRGRASGSFP